MPKPYPTKRIVKVLEKKGFVCVSQKGSHAKFKKVSRTTRVVIVPIHGKEIPHGTFRSILRQANLQEKDFKKK